MSDDAFREGFRRGFIAAVARAGRSLDGLTVGVWAGGRIEITGPEGELVPRNGLADYVKTKVNEGTCEKLLSEFE